MNKNYAIRCTYRTPLNGAKEDFVRVIKGTQLDAIKYTEALSSADSYSLWTFEEVTDAEAELIKSKFKSIESWMSQNEK